MIIVICKNKIDLHIYILYNCNLLMLLYINKILTRTVLLLGPGMVGTVSRQVKIKNYFSKLSQKEQM